MEAPWQFWIAATIQADGPKVLRVADGAPLGARLQLHFVDGRSLDETFSGSLFTEWGGCGTT